MHVAVGVVASARAGRACIRPEGKETVLVASQAARGGKKGYSVGLQEPAAMEVSAHVAKVPLPNSRAISMGPPPAEWAGEPA